MLKYGNDSNHIQYMQISRMTNYFSMSVNWCNESDKKAVIDTTWFDQIVKDSIRVIKRGEQAFVFTNEHIKAILTVIPNVHVYDMNGVYMLYV